MSTRTHQCPHCGYTDCRDANAAKNILKLGLSTLGHKGTWALDALNALGDLSSTGSGENQDWQDKSMNKESTRYKRVECQAI